MGYGYEGKRVERNENEGWQGEIDGINKN